MFNNFFKAVTQPKNKQIKRRREGENKINEKRTV